MIARALGGYSRQSRAAPEYRPTVAPSSGLGQCSPSLFASNINVRRRRGTFRYRAE